MEENPRGQGLSLPGVPGGTLTSVGGCSAVAMGLVDPSPRERRMDTHFLIPGPDLTPNCDFSRRTVFMDTE